MQDEGGAKKVNPVLERHWEKLVLGVVVALAVVYLGTRFSGPGDAAAKSVDKVAASFQAKKNQLNARGEAPKTIPEHVIQPPVAANRAPISTTGFPTEKKYNVVDAPVAAPAKFVFPTVTLAPPDPKPDGVNLSWTLSEVIIDPNDKTKPVAVPRATFVWRVERRKKGGEWEIREKMLKTEMLRYHDSTTVPKTEYEYRLTLGSNDPQWTKVTPALWTDKIGGPVAVTTPGIWFVAFQNIEGPQDDPPKDGHVYVTVTKYDSNVGEVEWKGIHLEGKPLGFGLEEGNLTSVHTVFSKLKGKMVKIDFNMGGKIVKIESEKLIQYERKECRPRINANGVQECDGPVVVKDTYRANVVQYTNEDGAKQTHEVASGPGKLPDRLCPDHGGAAPPKELTAGEKAAAHAKEAEAMLEEAESLWNKGTPADQKKAQKLYKTLIDRFQNVDAVKARLKDLKARANKEIK